MDFEAGQRVEVTQILNLEKGKNFDETFFQFLGKQGEILEIWQLEGSPYSIEVKLDGVEEVYSFNDAELKILHPDLDLLDWLDNGF